MAGPTREPLLTIRYQNRSPVDLLDLGNSLTAIGERYRQLHGLKDGRRSGRLYVRQMRPGSIVADLMPLLEQASVIGDYREMLAAFMANLDDLLRGFLLYSPRLLRRTSRPEARQVRRIVAPTANDSGAQLSINLNVEGHLHVEGDLQISPSIQIGSDQAREIVGGVQRFLREGPLPVAIPFQGEVLGLTQVWDEEGPRMTDRGVIQNIQDKPLKLLYENDQVRRKIVDRPENPFRFLYVVDGEVHEVKDRPVAYKISAVRDAYNANDAR